MTIVRYEEGELLTLELIRYKTTDQGTEGVLLAPGFQCFTFELPWKDNKPNLSCIPAGTYKVVPFSGRRFKRVYHILDVPNRSYILIHSGNFAGDRTKGYRSHTYGCILVGDRFGYLCGQRAVLNSRLTLCRLKNYLSYRPFILRIHWLDGVVD